MIFYFDENLPRQIAQALNILDRENEVYSVKDKYSGLKDTELIPLLAEQNAILITHDKKMKRNSKERQSLEQNQLTVFFVSSDYDYWTNVILFIRYWRDIVKQAKKNPKNAFFRIKSKGGIERID